MPTPKSSRNHPLSFQEKTVSIEQIRADYKSVENGITVYNSMLCIESKSYWLSWNFVTPSQRDLDDAVNTLQRISFHRAVFEAIPQGGREHSTVACPDLSIREHPENQ